MALPVLAAQQEQYTQEENQSYAKRFWMKTVNISMSNNFTYTDTVHNMQAASEVI